MRGSILPADRALRYLIGLSLLIALWGILSLFYPPVTLPSPWETLLALGKLVLSGVLFQQVAITLGRILFAFVLSILIGGLAGAAAGLFPGLYPLLKPAVDLAMSAPPISWLVLALVWFGTGSATPIFTSVVVCAPVVFANVYEGVRAVDSQLLDMARLFGAPGRMLVEDLYLPALAPHLFAGLHVAGSLAVRVGIMGEVLGGESGVGSSLALARIYLDTPQVFAWVTVTVLLLIGLENGLLSPLQSRAERWRHAQ